MQSIDFLKSLSKRKQNKINKNNNFPLEKKSEINLEKDNSPVYGCLKNGSLPTFRELHNKTIKKDLEYLDEYESILDEKNKDKCFYIYSDKINGSGIFRLLFLLSQYFGFDFFKSQYMDFNVKRPRFIYLNETTDNITSNQILQQINIFNDSRNKHGEYIKIVFGTDKTREGISLKNIQNIHF